MATKEEWAGPIPAWDCAVTWSTEPRGERAAVPMGAITVLEGGRLDVAPEDQHYAGIVSADDARKLARSILAALGEA